ncbi:gamma-F420-2:alpha-L-glutamate ligase [Virgibacillus natechei]|uniref:Gamma-F420-2:alpha-L-glutamate ligase n=1 Tax=Virgibacillus natechei TaxID=1216297 RepID=A0ABS4ICZ6_9BACI|nr:hypothetical protein [Virgibacillus natechei]MBP1968806.1 gamma-F420-2:alpha-L-glutamate ligase [Virgibacillus natechei]UZD11604.1 hypothetical protein OLD84_11610 [Virgibacillus natechei]
MKHGWLIYAEANVEENRSYINWMIAEAQMQNVSLELVIREQLIIGIENQERTIKVDNKEVHKPDFAIIRLIEPLLNLHLETCGITVFNSSSISSICNNKALTHHHIIDQDIPMVDTIFAQKDTVSQTPPMPYPFIIKETSGRGGKQVYYIQDKQDWLNRISSIATNDIIIQACNVQLGKDLRVFVIGKEIIGAVLRESTDDFRSNFKLGGSARMYQLHAHERSIISKIIRSFHFDMVGIDFLIGLNGELLFNEIEDVVGSRTLSTVSDLNILEKYITHITDKLKSGISTDN